MKKLNLTINADSNNYYPPKHKEVKKLTDAEIIAKEEKRVNKKLATMAVMADFKLTIVKIFNEAWNKGRHIGIQRLIETWEDPDNPDPTIQNLKSIFNQYGAVTVLKLLNSSYLNEIEGCSQLLGRSKSKKKRIKHGFETRPESKKSIEQQDNIKKVINNFVNRQIEINK